MLCVGAALYLGVVVFECGCDAELFDALISSFIWGGASFLFLSGVSRILTRVPVSGFVPEMRTSKGPSLVFMRVDPFLLGPTISPSTMRCLLVFCMVEGIDCACGCAFSNNLMPSTGGGGVMLDMSFKPIKLD